MRRWVIALALVLVFFSVGWSQVQSNRLSVDFKDLPLDLVLDSISYKTGYQFSYNAEIIPRGSLFALKRDDITVHKLLDILFVGTGLVYEEVDDLIILRKEELETSEVNKPKIISNISGWVRETSTRAPVESVNVHLNGTTIGSSTDRYGNYEIKNIPAGSYDLVFSHVGYQMVSHSVNVDVNTTQAVNALMNTKTQQLSGIEFVSSPFVPEEERNHYFKEFTHEFLGKTPNSLKCEIINPNVLNFTFSKEKNIMTAEASSALIIHNKALGYKITYELQSFHKSESGTREYGKALFKNMEPSSRRERRKWKKNRKRSYLGSMNHFFVSLINDNYYREGYRVYKVEDPLEVITNEKELVEAKSIIEKSDRSYEWVLQFDGMILVEYVKEVESPQYLADMNSLNQKDMILGSTLLESSPGLQRSVLELRADSLILDRFGQAKESFGLKTMGYWAWERVGDMMPAGYNPKTDNL